MKVIKKETGLAGILASELKQALDEHQRVVWLVPGGSNISISIDAMSQIDAIDSRKLVIMQTDERYVAPNHPDCNWLQLTSQGFDTKNAEVLPIILDDKENIKDVVDRYSSTVKEQFKKADFIIGQFGIGPDAHIAGIKPKTEASQSEELVIGYKAEDFIRVTLGFNAIGQMGLVVAFVLGDSKRWAIDQITSGNPPSLDIAPATILREVNSTIYTNQIKESKEI